MDEAAPGELTRLLRAVSDGHPEAQGELVELVYHQLRALARRSLRSERQDHTLQPTALVHEVYQRLVGQERVQWRNRAHFFAVAASLMRRVLVDHARARQAQRRGGQPLRVELPEALLGVAGPDADVLDVDRALGELEALDPPLARLVELRFFAGFTAEEAAEALGVSRATAMRDQALARAWLKRRLSSP